MQNGKLRAILFLIVVLMLLGSTMVSAEDGDQPSDESPIEINMWQVDFLDYLPAFQAYVDHANPNVTVNVFSFPIAEYDQQIQIALASGDVPDILMVPTWMLPDTVNGIREHLADLTMIDADAVANMQQSLAKGVWGSVNPPTSDNVQLIPVSSYPKAMFYRTDLFKKAGLPTEPAKAAALLKDWDAVAKAGKTFLTKTKKPLIGQWGNLFDALIEKYPIKYGKNGKFIGASNPQFKKTFDYIIKGMKEGWISKAKIHPDSSSYEKAAKAGAYGTVIGGGYEASLIKEKAYGGSSGQWAAIPLPGGTVDSGIVSFAVPANSAHPELALDAIAWLTSVEMQKWAYESPMAAFPSNLEMLSGGDWLTTKDPYFGGQNINKVLADAVISAKPDPRMWAKSYSSAPEKFVNALQSYANNPKQDPSKLWNNSLKEAEKRD